MILICRTRTLSRLLIKLRPRLSGGTKKNTMKFAKLFDLENNIQVLLTLEENEEKEESCDVLMRTDFDSLSAKMTFTYKDQETAEKQIAEFDNEKAKIFRSMMSEYK